MKELPAQGRCRRSAVRAGPQRRAELPRREAQQRDARVHDRSGWRCIARRMASHRACFMGHLLIENGHGLIVDVCATHATGRAEREAAEMMIGAATRSRRATLGASEAYDDPALGRLPEYLRVSRTIGRRRGDRGRQGSGRGGPEGSDRHRRSPGVPIRPAAPAARAHQRRVDHAGFVDHQQVACQRTLRCPGESRRC